jgi:hypothetical protein
MTHRARPACRVKRLTVKRLTGLRGEGKSFFERDAILLAPVPFEGEAVVSGGHSAGAPRIGQASAPRSWPRSIGIKAIAVSSGYVIHRAG